MKNGLALFLGVFATVGLSWAALLLTSHRQLGGLGQFKDPIEDTLYPQPLSGLADQGRLVYQDLGCISCHTQQVRREGFGADIERKWGERASYPRDYIRDPAVLFGQSRLGPDLRNVGKRLPVGSEAEYVYKLLYAPESKLGGEAIAPGMPAYTFLFDTHPTAGRQPSDQALKLTGNAAPPAGYEIVPTTRARALAAYLQSLNDTYDYPVERERNADAPKGKEEGAAKPAAAKPAGKPAEKAAGDAKTDAAKSPEKPKEGGAAKPEAAKPADKSGENSAGAAKPEAAKPAEKPKEGGH